MADSADSSSGSTNDPVTSAITTIREAAKWLVAAFGAVGGALIASLQFKDLGSLSGHERVLAIVGIGIGVLGVAVAIVGASIVLTAGRISLDDVSDKESDAGAYLAHEQDVLSGFHSIEGVRDLFRKASRDRVEGYVTMLDPQDEKTLDAAKRK